MFTDVFKMMISKGDVCTFSCPVGGDSALEAFERGVLSLIATANAWFSVWSFTRVVNTTYGKAQALTSTVKMVMNIWCRFYMLS